MYSKKLRRRGSEDWEAKMSRKKANVLRVKCRGTVRIAAMCFVTETEASQAT
jgi:hypothetical protein